MKRPRKLAADRARRFCAALAADAEGRSARPWWTSIHAVARKLDLPYDDVAALAEDCAEAGLVSHDQSQHTRAERKATVRPHSVTLTEKGRQMTMGKRL